MPEEGWAMVRRRRFTGTSVCNIPNATVAFFPFMARLCLLFLGRRDVRCRQRVRARCLRPVVFFRSLFRRLGAFLAMHSLCRRCGAVLLFPHGVGVVLRVWILFSAWARFISWMVRSMAALLPSSIFRASSFGFGQNFATFLAQLFGVFLILCEAAFYFFSFWRMAILLLSQ